MARYEIDTPARMAAFLAQLAHESGQLQRWSENLSWFGHHLGTTRMSSGPASGVVDADCRIHGVRNVYVASGSVFPTSGFANPTLTIVALALRLADHLKARIL